MMLLADVRLRSDFCAMFLIQRSMFGQEETALEANHHLCSQPMKSRCRFNRL